MEKKRVNIPLRTDIKDYYQRLGEKKGLPMSTVMELALEQQMDMNRGLEAIGNNDIIDYMNDIREKLDKLQGGSK